MNWDKLKTMLIVVALISSGTVGSMLYFVPMQAFAEFKAEYNYDRLTQQKRSLRVEVRDCNNMMREYGGNLNQEELEDCLEAQEELKAIKTRLDAINKASDKKLLGGK